MVITITFMGNVTYASLCKYSIMVTKNFRKDNPSCAERVCLAGTSVTVVCVKYVFAECAVYTGARA